ncbi:MAG: glycosyltransferase family 4 protein [Myxococcales bacterium]
MRVLMLLSTSSVTGPASLCLDDAKALKTAGHTVIFGLDTKRPGNYLQAAKEGGYEVLEDVTLCRKSTPVEIARDIAKLRQRMWNVDLVHCRFSHDHSLAWAAMQRLAERPALVRTAETAHSLRPGFLRGLSYRACDAVIVSCQQYQQRLRATHGLPPAKVHIVPGRVDVRRWHPQHAESLRNAWGVAPGEVAFGIVSRIKPERLHDVVLRAFARVALEAPKAKLVVIGRGEHEPAIRQMATGLGLDGRVVFAGYVTGEGLAVAYSALDAKPLARRGQRRDLPRGARGHGLRRSSRRRRCGRHGGDRPRRPRRVRGQAERRGGGRRAAKAGGPQAPQGDGPLGARARGRLRAEGAGREARRGVLVGAQGVGPLGSQRPRYQTRNCSKDFDRLERVNNGV